MHVLQWKEKSPYLKIIENAWDMLDLVLYKYRRQYHSVDDLRDSIAIESAKIDSNYTNFFYKSVPCRLTHVVERKGNCKKY